MTDRYRDPTAGIGERVADLLGRMTIHEKVAQLGAIWLTSLVRDDTFDVEHVRRRLEHGIGQVTRIGASTGLTADGSARLANAIQRVCVDDTRLGIPMMVHEEGVAGFCARGATVFPQALGLAAGWDTGLVGDVAGVIRTQMLAVGARQNLAPVLDVARDPRWGRVEETYGESPELAARLGVAYVKALQTDDLRRGVVCTGKHFLGYALSQGGRNQAPVMLGPRELREVHAEPFAAAIREAGLASVMNSYSSIDGEPVAASRAVLTDLLRGELGFDGVVVADYFAVMQLVLDHHCAHDAAEAGRQALSAGLDVELPALDAYRHLPDEVAAGRVDEALIDESCARVLAQKFRLGLFEDPYVDPDAALAVYDTPPQRALARRAAEQALVLLTNDGVLPLRPDLSRLAVLGPHADDPRLLQGDYHYPAHLEIIYAAGDEGAATTGPGDGDGDGTGTDQLPEAGGVFAPGPYSTPHVTPLAGLRAALPDGGIVHARGCDHRDPDTSGIAEAVAAAAGAEVAVVFVGARSGLVPTATVGEARDAVDLDLPGAQTALVEAVAATGTPTVVVVVSGRVHTLGRIAEVASALAWAAPPGEEGGAGIAAVLTGAAEPTGRLPVTLPRHVGQVPLHHDMRRRGDSAAFYGDYVDSPVTPLFPFGHGLGYTTFTVDGLTAEPGSTSVPTVLEARVTNTGDRRGTEVVQLYVTDEVASVARPVRELVGFTRLTLDPGATGTVRFTVDPNRLAFHGPDHRLVCEPGDFTFRIGNRADDPEPARVRIRLDGPVTEHDRRTIVATVSEVVEQ